MVEAFINQNKIVLMDPLNIKDLMEELSEKRQKQLSELDSAIKISNATTYIIMD